MAQRKQPSNTKIAGEAYNCREGFSRIAASPQILRKNIALGSDRRPFETKTGSTKQSLVCGGFDRIWSGGPFVPLRLAERQKTSGECSTVRCLGQPRNLVTTGSSEQRKRMDSASLCVGFRRTTRLVSIRSGAFIPNGTKKSWDAAFELLPQNHVLPAVLS